VEEAILNDPGDNLLNNLQHPNTIRLAMVISIHSTYHTTMKMVGTELSSYDYSMTVVCSRIDPFSNDMVSAERVNYCNKPMSMLFDKLSHNSIAYINTTVCL
jgi:hypothetical protein